MAYRFAAALLDIVLNSQKVLDIYFHLIDAYCVIKLAILDVVSVVKCVRMFFPMKGFSLFERRFIQYYRD